MRAVRIRDVVTPAWHSRRVDPNPLLTTTATAAAALVAIVGGLLVSRVINLASERSGLEQRLTDLRARLTSAQTRSDDFEERLLRWDVREVLVEGRQQFAEGGDLEIEAMLDEAGVERTVEDVRPFVEAEAERYNAIREHLAPEFAEGHPGVSFDELRGSGVIAIDRDDEDAYELVWNVLEKENPKPRKRGLYGLDLDVLSAGVLDSNWRIVHTMRSTAEATEHATLRRDADEARHQVDALNVQIEQTELAISRVARPKGVSGGLFVLGYMTLTGVIVPLGLMAAGLTSMNTAGAGGVVALFASGVGLLMAYVGVEVARMTGGSKSS